MNWPVRNVFRLEVLLDAAPFRDYRDVMSTETSATQKKINLRRPDIMEAVSAQVLSHYRSEIVENIRANGGVLSAGGLTVKLAE